MSETEPKKLRVRVGRNYAINFNILHGQRNAEMVSGPTNPLQRLSKRLVSVSVTEPGYDLIHNFNAVPILTRCPFVVTFESFLPRLLADPPNRLVSSYLERILLSDRCIALVAMSQYALRQMTYQHRASRSLSKLIEKTRLVYPAVPPARDVPKRRNAVPNLLFVGNDFFRKGGPAVVRAHKMLRASGIAVNTTIVSSLAWSADDYIGPPDPQGVEAAKRELATDGITHHGSLPNSDVRTLMAAADFLLLPTFHDTFGYVAIEALAAGTPVISTATCAQPEIVQHRVSGFLLDFENDPDVGKWVWISKKRSPGFAAAYWKTTHRLALEIAERISQLSDSRFDYEELSAGAIAQARGRFGVEQARARLEDIYSKLC